MERGNTTHGPLRDDALADELSGQLGPHGSNREEWAAAEPADDGDPAAAGGPIDEAEAGAGGTEPEGDDGPDDAAGSR